MTTVGRVDQTTVPNFQTGQTGDVGTVPGTGQGNWGVTNTALPPTQAQLLQAASSVPSMVRNFAPQTRSDFEVMLAEVLSGLKDTTGEAQQSRANNEMEAKKVQIQENQAKIEETKRKLDEAEAKKNSSNIFDILKLVFEALAAIAQIVLGAVLSVFGGAGAPFVATGIMMFAMMINNAVAKANDGAGILGSIVKAAGGDEKAVMGADGAFMAAMMIGIIYSVIKSPNPESMKAAIGQFTAMVVKLAQATAAAGEASMQVGSSGMKMDAAKDTAAAKKTQAESKEIEALMQALDDMIDMALSLLMQVQKNVNQMMDSYSQMLNDTGDTLSKNQFAG